MSKHFDAGIVLLLIARVTAAGAQGGAPNPPPPSTWLRADRIEMRFGPVTGSVNRTAIPNEYLEVTVARGTIHIEGGASDRIEWSLVSRDWASHVRSDTGRARPRLIIAAENPAWVGTSTWPDRYTLDLRIDPTAKPSLHADVRLRVPRDLKLLHITVHGEGNVVVDNFAGELTVAADSGAVMGTNLSGPVLLEARNGGIDLDLAQTPFRLGPINLLSHNGSITLLLPAQPSVVLDLNATCGNINYDFPLTDAKPAPDMTRNAGTPETQDVDCALRPKSLPPLPGVVHLHNGANLILGSGAVRIRAMALQGDINLKKTPNE